MFDDFNYFQIMFFWKSFRQNSQIKKKLLIYRLGFSNETLRNHNCTKLC